MCLQNVSRALDMVQCSIVSVTSPISSKPSTPPMLVLYTSNSMQIIASCMRNVWHAGIDYGQVLGLSWLFYEAQRSGPLPPTNRIPFRGDSALKDAAPDGTEMTGGWYDAGGMHDCSLLPFLHTLARILASTYIHFQKDVCARNV